MKNFAIEKRNEQHHCPRLGERSRSRPLIPNASVRCFIYDASAGPQPFSPARSRHSLSNSIPQGGSVITSTGLTSPADARQRQRPCSRHR